MARTILVPFDGSPLAEEALVFACEEHPDAAITVLHVVDPVEMSYAADPASVGYWDSWYEAKKEEGERILEEARETAGDLGVEVETATAVGRPARTVTDYAEDNEVDQIVMGSHGRKGLSRILMGSVAELVMRRATVPVTVVR